MSSRVWQVIFDPGEQSYRFMQYAGNDFIEVTLPPFSGIQHLMHVSLNQLEINGEPRADTGEIYLFPTGEQDAFRLIVQGEQVIATAPASASTEQREQLIAALTVAMQPSDAA